MVPTIAWMRQTFDVYNKKYFGGKLPVPQFSTNAPSGMWGCYDVDARFDKRTRKITKVNNTGILSLTSEYSRTENAVISTLLHEMIHEYIYLVMGIYPQDVHGREFMSIANKMNADGFKIARETIPAETDVKGGKNTNTRGIICVITRPNESINKWWICKIGQKDIANAKASASKLNGVSNVSFYECNTPALEHLQSDPVGLSGWGGETYADAVKKAAQYCGISPSVFSARNLKYLK